MRKFPLLILALFIFSSFSNNYNSAILPPDNVAIANKPSESVPLPLEKIASMKMKEAEKILGRKLSLKEKISFKIAQFKLKKELKTKEKGKPSKGQTAFVLSLIALGLLFVPYLGLASIPLAIVAIVQGAKAKKEDPNDKKAQTAIILGIVTLGLFVLAIIAVVIILASWGAWY